MKVCAAPLLAALVLGAALPAVVCVPAAGEEFPIRARLHGGPAEYIAGGAPHVFSLDLANATGADRREVHAVLMLLDDRRALFPPQIALEYADGGGRWHPAAFEHTDNAENVAVLGGEDGPGTVVPARATVTVKVRLRFASGTPAVRVSASATVIQRKGDDGDWVGESPPYAFRTLPAASARPAAPAGPTAPARSMPPADPVPSVAPAFPVPPADPGRRPADPARPADPSLPADPVRPADPARPADPSLPAGPAAPTGPGAEADGHTPPALAETGATRSPAGPATTAGALLLAGAVLLLAARRRRRSGRGRG